MFLVWIELKEDGELQLWTNHTLLNLPQKNTFEVIKSEEHLKSFPFYDKKLTFDENVERLIQNGIKNNTPSAK